MPPEDDNFGMYGNSKGKGNFKKDFQKALPGFIVLAAIIGIFIHSVATDNKANGGIKTNNTFSPGQNTIVSNDASLVKNKDFISLVYSETNGYSENVKQGVASLVLNRIKSNNFPDNIHDVVYQPNEFETVYTGTIVPYDSIPENDRKLVESAIQKAQAEDNTNGCMYYYKKYQVDPSADAQIRTMPGITVIDDVVFMTTFPY